MEIFEPKYDHLKIELENYCKEVKNLYTTKILDAGKSATGNLVQNFQVVVNFQDNQVLCTVQTVDYFQWVENGRGPGKFPPLNVIENWIETKNILPRPENGKLPSQKSLVFLIGRKIAEHGIEPGNQLAETVNQLNDIYIKKFQEALQLDFNDYASLIANEIYKMLNV